MRRAIIVLGVIALGMTGGAAIAAYAGTPHIIGSHGPKIHFSPSCRRMVVPRSLTVRRELNIAAQHVKCVVRRRDPMAVCIRHLGPPPTPVARFDHGVGNPGDWKGVDAMARWEQGVYRCAFARLSNKVS